MDEKEDLEKGQVPAHPPHQKKGEEESSPDGDVSSLGCGFLFLGVGILLLGQSFGWWKVNGMLLLGCVFVVLGLSELVEFWLKKR